MPWSALNILDRFHRVAKVNKALDDISSAEARAPPNQVGIRTSVRGFAGNVAGPITLRTGIISSVQTGVKSRRPARGTQRLAASKNPLPIETAFSRCAKTVPEHLVQRLLEGTVEREADSPS